MINHPWDINEAEKISHIDLLANSKVSACDALLKPGTCISAIQS